MHSLCRRRRQGVRVPEGRRADTLVERREERVAWPFTGGSTPQAPPLPSGELSSRLDTRARLPTGPSIEWQVASLLGREK